MNIPRRFLTAGSKTLFFATLISLLSTPLATHLASAEPAQDELAALTVLHAETAPSISKRWLAIPLKGIDTAYVNVIQLPARVGSLVQTGLEPVVGTFVRVGAALRGTKKNQPAAEVSESLQVPSLKLDSKWTVEPQLSFVETDAVAPSSKGERRESGGRYVGLGVNYRF